MKKYRTVLLNKAGLLGMAGVVLAIMFGLFYCRDKVFEGFARGIKLCGGVLIPSLFPFMFLANFIALSPLSSLLAKIVSPISQILFGFGGIPFITEETIYYLKSYAVLIILALIGSTPLIKEGTKKLSEKFEKTANVIEPIVLLALFIMSVSYLVDGSFNPFLYFRF